MERTEKEKGCETIYLSNLCDRVSVADLRSLLHELCVQFGQVVSVQVARGNKDGRVIRGTAFVSFNSVAQATAAVRNLKNFPFLGKPIKAEFARKRSDEIAKARGTYKPRYKPQRPKLEMDLA